MLQGGNAIGDNNFLRSTAGTVELQANETDGLLLSDDAGTVNVNADTLTIAGPGFTGGGFSVGAITGTGGIMINAPGFSQ